MCDSYGYVRSLTTLQHACSHLAYVRWDGRDTSAPLDVISPTDLAPIVRQVQWNLEIAMLRWGMGLGDRSVQSGDGLLSFVNAETIAGHEALGATYAARRCLVPATCYYVWALDRVAKRGTTVTVTVPAHSIFAFPGVWGRVETPDGPCESFAIVTCSGSPELATNGERATVILRRDAWGDWLDPKSDMLATLERARVGEIAVERMDQVA